MNGAPRADDQHVRRLLLAAVLPLLVSVAPARAEVPGSGQAFAVTREGDASLPDHTIFRPADLGAPRFKLPIVVWGNGGCRESNEEFRYFLTTLGSMGYFVVANGAPENPYVPSQATGLVRPQPRKLIEAIDWAIAQNASPASRFHDRLDPTRVVAMGQSCGGGEAIDASADPRVDATIAWNPYFGDARVLHAPVLYVSGGAGDYTVANTLAQWERTTVPAVYADKSDGGHTDMWDDPIDGSPSPTPLQREPVAIAPAWMAFVLYGREAGRGFFLGAGCGLCARPGWTVRTKGWDGFPTTQSEAPATGTPPACPATRTVTVRLPRGAARGIVYVDGRRRATLLRGRSRRLTVSALGAATIRVVGRSKSGRRIVSTRRTKGCA